MDSFKPSEAPKPIKNKRYKENVWLYVIPIVFLAVIFMLYIFAWEEAKYFQKINQIKIESEAALKEIATDSQKTITFLQSEIIRLENQITGKKDPKELEQYDNQIMTMEGKFSKNVMQHPSGLFLGEEDYKNYYVDTDYGQIQIFNKEEIQCDDVLVMTGTLNKIVPTNEVGKKSYEGFYMMLEDYECLNTKTDYMCSQDSDCILQKTSCDPCACLEVTNEENRIAIKCPAPDEDIVCDAYCPYNTPKCIGGKCQLIKSK